MLDAYALTKKVSMKNDILQSRYYTQPELELTLQQKKLLMVLVSRIDSNANSFSSETIQITDYCELFNINYDGSNRKKLRESLLDIGKKVFILPIDEKGRREQLFRWVDDIKIDYEKGTINIKLAECLRPYYLELKNSFISYQLGYTTSFHSKYSFSLYELCKAKANMVKFFITIDDAQMQLAYGKYKNYTDLMRFVIEPAITDINKHTDIKVSCVPEKDGKKVSRLMFCVQKKTGKELAEADKWKARVNRGKQIAAKMEKVFANELSDIKEREKFSDFEQHQYEKEMEKYLNE